MPRAIRRPRTPLLPRRRDAVGAPPEQPPPTEPAAAPQLGAAENAAALWLLLLGSAAVVVGGHDTVAGTEIMVRVWGTLVLGAGCVLVAGAWGLRRGSLRGRSLAMVAALLGVALGAMTFFAQAVNDEPDRRLLAWAAIVVVSAAAAWTVRSNTPLELRGQGVLTALPVLKSVVSVGVVISLAQFWYTSIYIPTTAPASLTFESVVRPVAKGDRVVLMGSVTVRNTSGTRVNLLASSLRLVGETLGERPEEAFKQDALSAYEQNAPGTYEVLGQGVTDRTVVAEGPLLPHGHYFEPGEAVTQPINARVPPDTYDEAVIEAFVVIARGQTLTLESAPPRPGPITDDGLVVVTPIPEAGWLRRLTRGDRYVRVEYSSDPDQDPDVRFVRESDAGRRQDDDFHERMWRFYGASFSKAHARAPLDR